MSTPLISRCFVESDSTTAAAFAAQTLRKPTPLARPCLHHGNSVCPGGHSRGILCLRCALICWRFLRVDWVVQ